MPPLSHPRIRPVFAAGRVALFVCLPSGLFVSNGQTQVEPPDPEATQEQSEDEQNSSSSSEGRHLSPR